jgi:CHASE3 domain sensor protein
MKLSSMSRVLAVSIIGSAVLLAGSTALMIWSWRSRGAASEWVRHSNEVQVQIERALSELKDLERAARDHLLTGEAIFLKEGEQAGVSAEAEMKTLLSLTAGDPVQQQRAGELYDLVLQKRALVGRFVGYTVAGQSERAVAQIREGPGRTVMGRIREIGGEMLNAENRRLADRTAALERAKSHQALTGFAIAAAELALVGASLLLAKRIRDLQRLVTICAWTKQVRLNGEWISIEEYLHRVHHIRISHGISPKRAKALQAELDSLGAPGSGASARPHPLSVPVREGGRAARVVATAGAMPTAEAVSRAARKI